MRCGDCGTVHVVHMYARQRLEVVIGWDTPKDVNPDGNVKASGRKACVWDGV